MSEPILGAKGKLTSLIGSLVLGLLLAVSCTTQSDATLPAAPAATDAPVPAATDAPAPAATDAPAPAATDTPAPAATDTPVPAATDTPAPAATDTPVPARTQSPLYANPTVVSPQPADTPTPPIVPTEAPTDAPTASNTTESDIRNFALENLTISQGTTVTWTNRDGASHTATSGVPQGQDGVWDSQVLSGGTAFSFTFNEPGVFPYFCRIHNSMRATVTVAG